MRLCQCDNQMLHSYIYECNKSLNCSNNKKSTHMRMSMCDKNKKQNVVTTAAVVAIACQNVTKKASPGKIYT